MFRDIFIFSEISACTNIFLKNTCFKNCKKLLSGTAMLESFRGTLAGLSENLFGTLQETLFSEFFKILKKTRNTESCSL